MMTVSYAEACQFGDRLKAMLFPNEETFVISIGAKAGNADCELQSCLVEISGNVGKATETFTGNGLDILSAAQIARMKLNDARIAHAKKLEKAKAA